MYGKDGWSIGEVQSLLGNQNSQNHRGGCETAVGTHTGGSISIGEHHKKLVSIYIFYKLYNEHLLLYDIYNVICFV